MKPTARHLWAFLLCTLGSFGVCLAAPPTDEALAAAVDTIAADALAKPGGAGLSVAVWRKDHFVVAKGYGLAEAEHEARADADTMFRIGSITKQFTAAAIMKLVEQGKVGLDESITKYLPTYNTQGRLITVRHLLTHTSGIKSYTELAKVMREMPEHTFKDAELVALFQDEPLAFEPGTKFAYCNSGYYLLGMIVKAVSGKDYCSFLQDEFFTPLKLERTRCDSNERLIKNRAQGYRLVGDKIANDQMMSMQTPGAAGMLISSARDLVTWASLLESGKVVSSESYKQMCTPFELADGESTGYGFGLGIKESDGRREVEHGGGIFGFNSDLASFPDEGLIVAVISNSESIASPRILGSITRAAFGVAETAAADLPVPEAEGSRFVGTYTLSPSIEFQVRYANGKVTVQASDEPELAVLYQGKGEFRASFDPEVKLVFDMAGSGPCPSFVLHQGGAHKAVRKP